MQVARVDLWLWNLDWDESKVGRLATLLSDDERRRAERFVHPLHAARFAAGRGRLREILAAETGASPQAVRFRYGPHGKPALESVAPSLFFNLSHTDDLAALALSRDADLGVDIEMVRPLGEDVGQFFSEHERAALARLPARERTSGFYRCWTRKEAFVKAVGGGLSIALDAFDVSLGPREPARLLRLAAGEHGPLQRWSLVHLEPSERCLGALAIAAPRCTIVVREWRR